MYEKNNNRLKTLKLKLKKEKKKIEQRKRKKGNSTELQKPNVEAKAYNNKEIITKKKKKLNNISQCS